MKVTVTIDIPINKAAWTLNYGAETNAEIESYVKQASDELVKEHWRKLGVLQESESA